MEFFVETSDVSPYHVYRYKSLRSNLLGGKSFFMTHQKSWNALWKRVSASKSSKTSWM